MTTQMYKEKLADEVYEKAKGFSAVVEELMAKVEEELKEEMER